ncbi:MAG: hypothetical protein LBB90_06785 [Tannerella sp.]|nr:hypothetical protein [Tannerella sp.]
MEESKKNIFENDSVSEATARSEQEVWERNWKIGWKKGWKIGWEKGMLEIRLEVAQRGLQRGMSVEMLSSVTGLDIEQIKNISESLSAGADEETGMSSKKSD